MQLKLEKVGNLILNGGSDISDLTQTVQKEVLKLGTGIVEDVIKRSIKNSKKQSTGINTIQLKKE